MSVHLTRSRRQAIIRMAPVVPEAKVHELYLEVFGADFAGSVTVERARQSIVDAVTDVVVSPAARQKEEVALGEEKKTVDVADLLGDAPQPTSTEPAAPADQAAEEAEKDDDMKARAKTSSSKKPGIKTKKASTPRKAKAKADPVILLRDPEIKRDTDGRIIDITGKCTWKEGNKYVCNETRTIHAADAFQVRFCEEHKIEHRKQKNKEKRAAKAKAK